MNSKRIIIAVALAIAVGRLLITPRLDLPTAEGSYEAVAHLFVGGLFGAWLLDHRRWDLFKIGLAISLVELVMFLLQSENFIALSLVSTGCIVWVLAEWFEAAVRSGGGK